MNTMENRHFDSLTLINWILIVQTKLKVWVVFFMDRTLAYIKTPFQHKSNFTAPPTHNYFFPFYCNGSGVFLLVVIIISVRSPMGVGKLVFPFLLAFQPFSTGCFPHLIMCTILHLKTSKWKSGWQNVFVFFPNLSGFCSMSFFLLYLLKKLPTFGSHSPPCPTVTLPRSLFHETIHIKITRALSGSELWIHYSHFISWPLSSTRSLTTFPSLEDSVLMTWLPCPIFLLLLFFRPSLIIMISVYFRKFPHISWELLKLQPNRLKHSNKVHRVQVVSWHANQESHAPEAAIMSTCIIHISTNIWGFAS